MKIIIQSIVIEAEGREACQAACELIGRVLRDEVGKQLPGPKRKRQRLPDAVVVDFHNVAEIKALQAPE